MSFQKCPVCDGSGFFSCGMTQTNGVCQTCLGKRIIHTETGKPPQDAIPDPPPVSGDLKAEDIVTPMSVLDDISDEEIQYWASPYYDEIQAQKELRKKELAENKE